MPERLLNSKIVCDVPPGSTLFCRCMPLLCPVQGAGTHNTDVRCPCTHSSRLVHADVVLAPRLPRLHAGVAKDGRGQLHRMNRLQFFSTVLSMHTMVET